MGRTHLILVYISLVSLFLACEQDSGNQIHIRYSITSLSGLASEVQVFLEEGWPI